MLHMWSLGRTSGEWGYIGYVDRNFFMQVLDYGGKSGDSFYVIKP